MRLESGDSFRRGANLAAEEAIRASFLATPAHVRAGLKKVMTALSRRGIGAAQRGVAEIVLAEILNNIAEHAYAETGSGRIEISIWLRESGLSCEVTDEGRPMPRGTLPRGEPADLDVEECDLPEGGFGWYLIRELTREIRYEREAGCNRLSFLLPTWTD